MTKYYLTVKSYTEAMRGKNYLNGFNIQCSVEKVGGRGGCGYAIAVKSDPEKASRLLGTAGITVLRVGDGKANGIS